MRPYRRLLVHFDTTATTQPAFQRAVRLAAASRGSLRLVDVLPTVAGSGGGPPPFLRLVRETMLDHLAQATAEARAAGVTATSALLTGDEATALIHASVTWRADVLLRSHAVHQRRSHPAGPVDSQVLRRCPCPVWLVTPRHAQGERVVVAAVDPDPDDPVRHDLSLQVVRTAMQVAASSRAILHVVHAWTAYGHQILASHANRRDLLAHYAACRSQAEARFEALWREADVPASTHGHLVEGQNDKVLTAFVDARRASLLVLGTIARTGLAGLVMGNTAERVLRQVRCSVLALKPAGFAAATPEGRANVRMRARS